MNAAKEKAPTQQRQGFGVNHYEAIHMADVTAVKAEAQQLVRVFDGVIGGIPSQVCDGRELHVFLQNGKQFSDWIKQRIEQYGFDENQDFSIVSLKSETIRKYATGERKGVAKQTNYHLTLDMAKELSMVENNEQGRAARRYFIARERLSHSRVEAALPEPGMAFTRHSFLGRPVSFMLLDGKPWVCAANICTALSIGSSDRITRSLPTHQKRRIQRGVTALWMVDAAAAMRGADYCRDDVKAEQYRRWLAGVLAEMAGAPAAALAPRLDSKDLACLFALCKGMDRVHQAHQALQPVFESMGSAKLYGVGAALETFQHGVTHLRHRFGTDMAAAAQASGLADEHMSANLLGIKLEGALAAAPLQGELLDGASKESAAEQGLRTLLSHGRFMCSFDPDGRLAIKEVPDNAVVLGRDRLARYIADPEGPPAGTLVEILEAVSKRLKTLH